MTPMWIFWASGILAALGVLTALFKVVRALVRGWRRFSEFLDDWRGRDERPGFPAVPGVPQRLRTVEQTVQAIQTQVEHELRPNGGSSLRDVVDRVEAAVTDTTEGR